MYFTTEELWFNEWEFKGTPWSNPYFYNKFNPREYVRNWKTPTLVIHGGRDFRVPISEGLGAFTALQRQGIPSKFVHFPTENHWVLSPLNSVEWYKHVLEWFGQWLK
jgi:dipeptidyl aminopeptidase/acylaminoacyl peptidase